MGDWIMAWAWCLPTAFDTPVTYFYVVFFAILLVHRQMRDDEACTEKYGKDWAKYVSLLAQCVRGRGKSKNGVLVLLLHMVSNTDLPCPYCPSLPLPLSVQDRAFSDHPLLVLKKVCHTPPDPSNTLVSSSFLLNFLTLSTSLLLSLPSLHSSRPLLSRPSLPYFCGL
jgi:hypothetical protein